MTIHVKENRASAPLPPVESLTVHLSAVQAAALVAVLGKTSREDDRASIAAAAGKGCGKFPILLDADEGVLAEDLSGLYHEIVRALK